MVTTSPVAVHMEHFFIVLSPVAVGFLGGVALHLKLIFIAYLFSDILALRKKFKIPKIFYSESVLKFQKFANDIAILAIFPELVVLPCNKIL